MKAEDLRVGNYHFYHIIDKLDERKEWDDICKIDGQDIEYLEHNPDDPDYKPIPLTEEWIKKLGFIETNTDFWDVPIDSNYKAHHLVQMANAWTYFIDFEETGKVASMIAGFNYVHQLQNLYFALTGQELTDK